MTLEGSDLEWSGDRGRAAAIVARMRRSNEAVHRNAITAESEVPPRFDHSSNEHVESLGERRRPRDAMPQLTYDCQLIGSSRT